MNQRPLLLGHRGTRANKSIPENTLASFDRALADGCDGFEFDVRLSSDQRPVIQHDPKAKRLEIARTKAAVLNLPSLETVLDRYANRAILDIELKVPGLEQITAQLLDRYRLKRGGIISSFLPEVLQNLSTARPAVPLGLICESESQLARWRSLPIQYVIPHHKLISRERIAELHRAKKKVLVWTVNSRREMLKFADWKVDGIISDKTELLRQTLAD